MFHAVMLRALRAAVGTALMATGLVAVSTLSGLPGAGAATAAPDVPENLKVPAGNDVYLVGHAKGTINYMCATDPAGFIWKLDGPEAVLSDDAGAPIIKHFKSKDPAGAPRITWQHNDGSTVWGNPTQKSIDPKYVKRDATPWLLVEPTAKQAGGGATLTGTTYVQRVHTNGGLAPGQATNDAAIPPNANGCAGQGDVGTVAKTPYTADVFFFKAS